MLFRSKRVVDRFGRIDALVNNAGVAVFKPLLETSFEEWSRVLAVNLSGPFLCTQACAPVMLRNGGGSVVNIGSISGLRASTLRVAYGTSKAGLAHLTRQQAAELGNVGIRVNAVAPGPVDTAMAKQVHTPDIRAGYHDAIPLNRYGEAEEIASVVRFLAGLIAGYEPLQLLPAHGSVVREGRRQLLEYITKLRRLSELYLRGYDIQRFAGCDQDNVSRPTSVPHAAGSSLSHRYRWTR